MTRAPLSARALLFVAVSGVAVPACQQYEAGGTQEREQVRTEVTAPTPVGAESLPVVHPPTHA